MWPKATTINWRSNLQLEPASVGNNNTDDNGTSKQKKIAKTRDAKCATLTLMSFLTWSQLHLSFKRLLHLNLRQCHKPLCISEHILYHKVLFQGIHKGKWKEKKNGSTGLQFTLHRQPIPVKLVLIPRDEHAGLPADDLRYAIATEPKESLRQKQPQPTKDGACWRLERL